MTSSAVDIVPCATSVECTDDELHVVLTDGRTLSVRLVWFPRLLAATSAQRGDWRLIGGGQGIRWESLDEDLSVRGLLRGERGRR
jgi:hypothetical protein